LCRILLSVQNFRNVGGTPQSLGLELSYAVYERKVAFFYLGDISKKEQLLGIWEVSQERFIKSHFAFYVSYDELLQSPSYLRARDISLVPDFGLDTSEPIVHPWMPAASYYFKDLDGNLLEYITLLDGEAKPNLEPMHLSQWFRSK
jgi:lactoylglutathione lyase